MSKPNREEIVNNIKTCVTSSKGGISISNLARDYHMLIGDPLPYRGLGYNKLEDFIHGIQELKIISGPRGDFMIQTVTNDRRNQLSKLATTNTSQNNNSRFNPKSSRKPNDKTQPFPRKSGSRWQPNTMKNNGRSLRTPSLQRNMSQPTTNIPRNNPLHRTNSTPANKTSPRISDACNSPGNIPPLLSVDTSAIAPVMMRFPNISLDRRRAADATARGPRRPGQTSSTNSDVVYSQVVCPVSSIRKPSIPTAEVKATGQISKLKEYVKENNLGEIVYKTIEMATGTTKQYISSVTIGKDFKVSTYPNGGNTTQEALELAANLAFNTLLAKKTSKPPNLPATENASKALPRIIKILEGHPCGVWANKVPDEYMELYKEQLPADWLKETMECPQVDSNAVSEKQIILTLSEVPAEAANNEHVVTTPEAPERPVPEEPVTELQKETKVDDANGKDLKPPPPLQLPQEENWPVYVTNANSTTEVWLRLIGEKYSSLYENLATEMELHYLEHHISVDQAVESQYYALALDDCVHRVQVASIDGDFVNCLLLDHGQVERVPVEELRPLDPSFLRLPFQGIQCELQGLEQFRDADSEALQALLLDSVVGKTFVAQPAMELLRSVYTVGSVPVTVRLYDTSTDDDIDINYQIMIAIASKVLIPRLPKEGRVEEVFVCHIGRSLDIYVHPQREVWRFVQEKIAELNLKNNPPPPGTVKQPVKGRMYVVPVVDGFWYRCVMMSTLPDDKVLVFYVDHGIYDPVEINKLVDLEEMSPELANIPHQVVRCWLHHILPCEGARICDRTVERLTSLVEFKKPHLLKVITAQTSSAPASVELFYRIAPDNLLVSLNNTLALDKQAFDFSEEKADTSPGQKKRKEESSKAMSPTQENILRVISQPKVPDVGGYLDVNVTLAASPCNFVVQPWEQGTELEQLMVDLQGAYSAGNHTQAPDKIEAQEGGVYAALHSDGKWYRVQVNNLLRGDHLTVYFVDFGDHTVMSTANLRPLAAEFCTLPCQAIKAKLSGIRPRHSDWSVEDCLRFQELVCNRQFVSLIQETGPDLINPSDTVLGLKLIDTSNDQFDVDIGEVLVKENRATLIL